MGGQFWAGYYSHYYVMHELGVKEAALLGGQMLTALSAGWWWCFGGYAVITDRPDLLERDAQGELHSAIGPALRYRDGWCIWAWHGRRVPRWVIENPTMDQIAAESNVEIRRCAIESYGWDRFARELEEKGSIDAPARAADPGNPGQELFLYPVPAEFWGSDVKLLLATNGSTERDGTRRRYGLTVPARIKDPLEAAAWTYGLSGDEYARTQRRT